RPTRSFGDDRVVGAKLADRLLLSLTEPEVREAYDAGVPHAADLVVGGSKGLDHARSHLRRGTSDGEPAIPPDRAAGGAGRVASEQDGGPLPPGGGGGRSRPAV